MKTTKEEFIKKAILCHPGENLDYSQVVYINNRTPVKIIDRDIDENGNEYGEFWQTPSNHLKGQSHPRKKGINISKSKRSKTKDIIRRFREVHKGENLDYSQVNYVNMHTKVKIICHELDANGEEYGEFWQEPVVHLKGCTHPRLSMDKNAEKQRYTTETFIKKCIALYGENKYSYDSVNYVNSKTKVKIFCNKIGGNGKAHGYFEAYPDLFLQGKGCPKCGNQLSNGENEIYDFICSIIDKNKVIQHDIKLLNGKEIDIYVPSHNLALEYNGLRWHSEKFGKDKWYHINKTEECNKQGVTLLQIFEDEYLKHKELVLDKIKQALNANTDKIKIGARKCEIKEINKKTAKSFLDKYHIQGFVASTIYIGAFYNNILVGVVTFLKTNKSMDWILNRLCCDNNYTCQGLASKMFKYFIKKYNPKHISSFLDRRWHNINHKNIYEILGFNEFSFLKPDYSYTKYQGERLHKFQFRKNILHKKYNLPLSMTELEMAKKLGYDRIWNCGLIKYVWTQKKV